jgi:CubicO group peptidase (beta-lactamase class C family)
MWLASCTKLITVIATLQCIERGLFTLDDPADVDRLLPEWKDTQILTGWTDDETPILQPAKEKVTLRRLLTHTSGLLYDFMHPDLIRWRESRGETPMGLEAPVLDCYLTPLVCEPGAAWAYSPGIDLAGLMVARANNCTLEVYMHRHIFDLLGMGNTSFHPKEHNNMIERLMPMATRVSDDEIIDGYEPLEVHRQPVDVTYELGGSGLFSTAADFLKVLKSVLRNDGKLLQSESIDLLFAPTLSQEQQASMGAFLSIPPFAPIMAAAGEPPLEATSQGHWSHSLGGVVGLYQSQKGFEPGWMQWGGAPGLKWWIDRKGGTCGFFATALQPMGEPRHVVLSKMFQTEVVEQFSTSIS